MEYFDNFPSLIYDVDNTGRGEALTHILRRFQISKAVKDNVNTFDRYTIKDGESPDLLAYKVYGDTQYHWVLMMFNDIYDPFLQWPVAENHLLEYAKVKYGSEKALYYPHHFEDANGDPVEYLSMDVDLVSGSNVITNYNIITGYISTGKQLTGIGTNGAFITAFTNSSITLDSTVTATGRERLYSFPANATMITNYDYEVQQNNLKRRIKLPKQSQLTKIIQQVENVLKSS